MAKVTLKGNEIHTNGELPKVGTEAPDFKGVKSDLSELSLSDLKGKKVVINVFPSLDTSVCAASVRRFNKEAASHPDTVWPNQHTIRFVYIGIDIHHFAVKFDFRVGGIQCRLPGISKPLLQGHKDLVDLFIVVRPVRCGTACTIVTVAAAISIPAR